MNVVIIGAGPAGLLLAHRLLARSSHYQVFIYEQRSDPRKLRSDQRAFVLSLTERGQTDLKAIDGLWSAVEQRGVAIRKTGVYSKKRQQWQVFERSSGVEKYSLLINRNHLCSALLDELEKRKYPGLHLNFDTACAKVDLKAHQVTLAAKDGQSMEQPYDLLVGADGIHSVVKAALLKQPGFDFQQSYFDKVWKALHLPQPQAFAADTSYFFRVTSPATDAKALPIQISGAAIPELDDQFCLLIFWGQAPDQAQNNPPGIETPTDLQKMIFEQWLPGLQVSDAAAQAFCERRPSSILETHCDRYHDQTGQAVLVGDAAHAMSSFLAQGCQAAFADVVALDRCLQASEDQLQDALPQYSALQVKEGHAITELNILLRPQAKWVSSLFSVAMMMQGKLNQRFPNRFSPTPSTLLSKTSMPYAEICDRFKSWFSLIRWSNQRMLAKQKSAQSKSVATNS
ncbi:NAD(P)/FAD-dependent oxidoreductase [Acaryochloris sp. IP29b_bin.148]|uniref:FAD-dependent oxidoreductase n=1 Tax=Acaryochloris sp. IP29b_bin.148 TaxID=2969218 RepID=UPI0026066C90|nr:NAD(P)/FAD-dependent oxidoreductase [Acaryochloris sp. IP29b_bin.148]